MKLNTFFPDNFSATYFVNIAATEGKADYVADYSCTFSSGDTENANLYKKKSKLVNIVTFFRF